MAIRPEFRWWILTAVIVGVLLLISALALARADVVWVQGQGPSCPQCRESVPYYSRRCPHCREQYDWVVEPDDLSPYSPFSLSAVEVDWLKNRKEALGRDVAVDRVAGALGISHAAAALYLDHLGRGRCGFCGGTGLDLSAASGKDVPCPVCFGRRESIACGGDRRIRVGDEGAHVALGAYEAKLEDLRRATHASMEEERNEVKALDADLVSRFVGTQEMQKVVYWPDWGKTPASPPRMAVAVARGRLDAVLHALEGD